MQNSITIHSHTHTPTHTQTDTHPNPYPPTEGSVIICIALRFNKSKR